MTWCRGQNLLDQLDHLAPALGLGSFVQPHQQFRKRRLLSDQLGLKRPKARVDAQQPRRRLSRLRRQDKLPAVGQIARLRPGTQPLFQHLQFRRAHLPLAQMSDPFLRVCGIAGLEQRSQLGHAQPGERLPQAVDALFARSQRLGLEQIAPGSLGVVQIETALASFDKAAGELHHQFMGASMAARAWLFEKAKRLLQAAVFQRLLSLPQS